MRNKAQQIREFKDFKIGDIVEVINPKSKYFKTVGKIDWFNIKDSKVTITGMWNLDYSFPYNKRKSYPIEQLIKANNVIVNYDEFS